MSTHDIFENAGHRARSTAIKALGSRVRLRLFAISAWSGFLGAIPIFFTLISFAPPEVLPVLGFGQLTLYFFVSWLCAFLAASMGALLSHRSSWPRVPHGSDHGR